MVRQDINILTKKILVGFALTIVPLLIIGGGLWLISHYLLK
jgi:hypothetical protein